MTNRKQVRGSLKIPKRRMELTRRQNARQRKVTRALGVGLGRE